jgi:hypothetical protein
MPVDEYEVACERVAKVLAKVPGLTWKAWIINREMKEAGGLYLFESRSAASRYVDGPILMALKAQPGIERVEVKQFELMPQPSKTTRFAPPSEADTLFQLR